MGRMKILIVGSNKEYSIESFYKAELEQSEEIELFNAHGMFFEYYYKSLFNKIIHRLGFSRVLRKINAEFLRRVDVFQPDIIWVFKGMEIFPKSLQQLKEKGIKLVNYNPDHPFQFDSKGSGNENILNNIELYDLHFSYSKKIIREFEAKFNVRTSYLPFAYHMAKENSNQNIIRKVGFIGNPDMDRWNIINSLLDAGIEVDVFGIGWEKFIVNKKNGLTIHPPVFKDDFIDRSQDYALQLNVFRPQNEESHNMRTFEMPALGCIMLAPDSEEHRDFFEDGVEAYFYSNVQDLIELTRKVLAMETEDLISIRKNAYDRSIRSKYGYSDRAIGVKEEFEKLLR